jgi:hypothetical protein
MSDNNSSGGTSIFVDVLAVAFIVLKLCGVIDWPWWLVLSPIWASILIVVVVFIVFLLVDRW